MSVLPSKKNTSKAVDVMPIARALHKKTLLLVLDKEVVPQQLNSEFRYPTTGTVRDMCTNLAVALQCDIVKDHRRRTNRLLAAHDDTVILDEQLTLLASSRLIDRNRLQDIITTNVEVSRAIKQIMMNDRVVLDKSFGNKPKEQPADISNKKDDLILQESSNDYSVKELKRKALETSPEFEGIINNPTDPESPVIDKVREIQRIKAEKTETEIRRARKTRSSK